MMKVISGKVRDVKLTMWIIAILSLTFLTMDQLPAMIEYLKSLM